MKLTIDRLEKIIIEEAEKVLVEKVEIPGAEAGQTHTPAGSLGGQSMAPTMGGQTPAVPCWKTAMAKCYKAGGLGPGEFPSAAMRRKCERASKKKCAGGSTPPNEALPTRWRGVKTEAEMQKYCEAKGWGYEARCTRLAGGRQTTPCIQKHFWPQYPRGKCKGQIKPGLRSGLGYKNDADQHGISLGRGRRGKAFKRWYKNWDQHWKNMKKYRKNEPGVWDRLKGMAGLEERILKEVRKILKGKKVQ